MPTPIISASGSGGKGYDPNQVGVYAPMDAPFSQYTTIALTAQRAHLIRFICPRSMVITKMSFGVQTIASVDDHVDLGVYDALTMARLGSTGDTAGLLIGATGRKVVNLAAAVQLIAGQVYYAAFAMGAIGGTAATLVCTNLPNGQQMFGPTNPFIEQSFAGSAFPLPASLSTSGSIASCPFLGMLQ